jgi:hypothetical protein
MIAFEVLHVRIHREDIVPGLLQAVINQIPDRVAAVVARDARNGDALLSQKVMDFHFKGRWRHRRFSSIAPNRKVRIRLSCGSNGFIFAPPRILPTDAS